MTDDDLIALAKKATPGPWEATDGVVWIDTREQVCCGRSYTECCGQYDIKGGQEKIADSGETDAAYIAAANPAAIIALIERRRAEVGKMWSASEEHRRDARHWEEKADTLSRNLAAEQRESSKLRAEVERLTRERNEARQENQYLRDEKAALDVALKQAIAVETASEQLAREKREKRERAQRRRVRPRS